MHLGKNRNMNGTEKRDAKPLLPAKFGGVFTKRVLPGNPSEERGENINNKQKARRARTASLPP